ncbi:MAG: DUF4412 domain-containing protein [Bacteroidota bacterium]
MKIQSFTCFFVLLTIISFAQPDFGEQNPQSSQNTSPTNNFEGSIKFQQITLNDTNYYTYHIKNNKIRLDVHENCANCKDVENSMLFDINKKTITALNPSRKLYINVPPKPYNEAQDENYKIIKSTNCKKIHGYKCSQWRVKNVADNTEIAYWVAEDNFTFFDDFLRLWNRSEKHASYFLQIPETEGFFPLLSVERTTLREQKMRLEVIEINKQTLDKAIFEIPKDYQSYDH